MTPPLRVVHVINNLPVGGAERFLVLLASVQRRLGTDAQVVTLVEPNPLAADLERRSVPHTCLRRRRLNDPRLALDLGRLLGARRPDVVHTHLFYADTFGRLAARRAGVPVVVSTEHSTEGGALSRRRRAAMRWTAPLAHRIVAVSEAVRQAAAARLGIDAASMCVIPNGIDIETWEQAEPLARADLDVEDEAVVAGCVGRLDAPKGHDVLLQALARLEDPRLRLVVAGDGPLRAQLEAQARALGVAATVRWLGFRNDVARVLRALDVFVLPSRYEGHSMALLEAMAAGRPCLASDIPEIAATLGDAGVRVPAGDAAAFAAALGDLVADAALRRRLGAAARRAVRRYAIEASAAAYADVYAAALAGRRPIDPDAAR